MSKSSKADTRVNAATLAALMADPIGTHDLALGRKWRSPSDGAKRVRSIARDTIDRFVNRTGYTAHDYTLAECEQIVAAAREHGRGQGTADADSVRAVLTGQNATPSASKGKRSRKGRKAASVAQDAPEGTAQA